jgi:hypothetical protein
MMQQTIENKRVDALGTAAQMVAEAHINGTGSCVCGAPPQLLIDIVLRSEPPQLLAVGLCVSCLARPFREILREVHGQIKSYNQSRKKNDWQPML